MSMTSCHYLFHRTESELFPKLEAKFVDQSLTTLMKIVDYLMEYQKESLFVFDPVTLNNQCHLHALFIAQALENSEKIDRKFCYLSFFLSHAFLADPKLADRLVCKTLEKMGAEAPTQALRSFVKDSDHIRTRAARLAMNTLFSDRMKTVLQDEELSKIAHSDLQLPAIGGKESLYTFPKFAGVAYFLETVSAQKIPLIFKIKVMTKEGNGCFSYSQHTPQSLSPTQAVIVFEMMIPGESLIFTECQEIAKRCPSHAYRNVSSKNRHALNQSCLFCSTNKIDISPYQKKFEPILAKTREMLLAVGADFVLQNQRPFLTFLSDRAQYPKLTELFNSSLPVIKDHFLSMKEPLNLSVCHVYPDHAQHAFDQTLIIDANYENHLTQRGLI